VGEKGNDKGSGGAAETPEGALVLDAGALIAFERGDRRIRALLMLADKTRDGILVPASALAQVWRGGARSAPLVRLIAAGKVDSLDELRAREVGERLGRRDKSDIADAHVVCCALDRDADLITSDPEDMEALAGPGEEFTLVSV
jgi:hypothetical protein